MSPERWQQINELFHEALACEASEREDFLAAKCAGDEPLRLEVESLLSSLEEDEGFIEAPAGDLAAELLGTHRSTYEPGRQIQNYRIVRQLGSGGMGEVYLAEDTRLSRKVALKILPPHFTVNPDRARRFEREARAASALNHPNIVTIHEIGNADSTHFIATEFVDGKTLRELIDEQPLSLNETINVIVQVAEALTAAHASGIVHRDIKPENVMVRLDGYVKILDFGLAKLTDTPASDPELESVTLLQSSPGLVMGTVQYMSPEQARGKKVDARTDVWSLGVVLYELLAGHLPFSGETPSHVMVSLMEKEALPLTDCRNVPLELNRIVTKALRKNPIERYQTARQLAGDLKNFRRDVESAQSKGLLEAVPSHPARPGAQRFSPTNSATETTPLRTRGSSEGDAHRGTETAKISPPSRISSAQYLMGEIKQHRTGVVAGLLSLSLAVALMAVWYSRTRGGKSIVPSHSMNVTKLAIKDDVVTAAISPDGKSIAYVVNEKPCCFLQSIRLRHIETTRDIQIDPPSRQYHHRITFSPDGNYLYLTDGSETLYRMLKLGGPKSKLLAGVSSPISFSPDGKRITFLRRDYPLPNQTTLMVANSDGSREEQIASRIKPEFFDGGPAWSPNQPAIACGAGGVDDRGRYMTVVELRLDGGEQRQISAARWLKVGSLGWLADGSGLLMLAKDHASISPQLWRIAYPEGHAHRITNELNTYDNLSLTADSTKILAEQTAQPSNIWIMSNVIEPRKITSGVTGSYENLSWLSETRLIYDSNDSGQWDIWSLDVEKGTRSQLTMNVGVNAYSTVSPDGRFIVFASNRAGPLNIWRMNSDGSNPKQLTSGSHEDVNPRCTPDGKWVVYESTRSEKTTLWKVPFDGGEPIQLVDKPVQNAAISPDGEWVFYQSTDSRKRTSWIVFPDGRRVYNDSTGETTIWKISINGGNPKELLNRNSVASIISRHGNLIEPNVSPDGKLVACRYQPVPDQNTWKAAIISLEGVPIQVFDIGTDPFWHNVGFRWSADGQAITCRGLPFNPNGSGNLWSRPINGAAPEQLTKFDSERIFSFSWSRNGQLALSRGVETRELILMTEFR